MCAVQASSTRCTRLLSRLGSAQSPSRALLSTTRNRWRPSTTCRYSKLLTSASKISAVRSRLARAALDSCAVLSGPVLLAAARAHHFLTPCVSHSLQIHRPDVLVSLIDAAETGESAENKQVKWRTIAVSLNCVCELEEFPHSGLCGRRSAALAQSRGFACWGLHQACLAHRLLCDWLLREKRVSKWVSTRSPFAHLCFCTGAPTAY